MLPHFLIVGAQKAGTTALFHMLSRHPQVLAPTNKELHFFDVEADYARGVGHYGTLFPSGATDRITFEATPAYLYIEACAARIHAHLPQMQLIAVLRDPVQRAYSAWNMFRDFATDPVHGHLHDARSFEQAVSDELGGAPVRWEHRYVDRGYYAQQLERFIELFGREALLVLDHHTLRTEPARALELVLAHVGLAPHTFDSETLRSTANVRAYSASIDQRTEALLHAHYAPHNKALVQLLGQPFSFNGSLP